MNVNTPCHECQNHQVYWICMWAQPPAQLCNKCITRHMQKRSGLSHLLQHISRMAEQPQISWKQAEELNRRIWVKQLINQRIQQVIEIWDASFESAKNELYSQCQALVEFLNTQHNAGQERLEDQNIRKQLLNTVRDFELQKRENFEDAELVGNIDDMIEKDMISRISYSLVDVRPTIYNIPESKYLKDPIHDIIDQFYSITFKPIFQINQEQICKTQDLKVKRPIIWDLSNQEYDHCDNCQGEGGWANEFCLEDLHASIFLHAQQGDVLLWDSCIKQIAFDPNLGVYKSPSMDCNNSLWTKKLLEIHRYLLDCERQNYRLCKILSSDQDMDIDTLFKTCFFKWDPSSCFWEMSKLDFFHKVITDSSFPFGVTNDENLVNKRQKEALAMFITLRLLQFSDFSIEPL